MTDDTCEASIMSPSHCFIVGGQTTCDLVSQTLLGRCPCGDADLMQFRQSIPFDICYHKVHGFLYVDRGSSAVECRTRNRESPGSNPPLHPFRSLGIFVPSTTPHFAVYMSTWLYTVVEM